LHAAFFNDFLRLASHPSRYEPQKLNFGESIINLDGKLVGVKEGEFHIHLPVNEIKNGLQSSDQQLSNNVRYENLLPLCNL